MLYLYEFDDNLGHPCIVGKISRKGSDIPFAKVIKGNNIDYNDIGENFGWNDKFVIKEFNGTIKEMKLEYPEEFL